jgi:hypothetical protein
MVKQINAAKNNAVTFTKNLSHMIVAVSLTSLGAYAAYMGRKEHTAVYMISLLFAGAVNALIGLVTLYRALMSN